MKKMAYIYNTKRIFLFSLIFACINVFAKENIPNPISNSVVYTKVASGCAPSTSQTDLDVNNVRTTILAVAKNNTFTLRFPSAIAAPDDENLRITSSTFVYDGVTCRIENILESNNKKIRFVWQSMRRFYYYKINSLLII